MSNISRREIFIAGACGLVALGTSALPAAAQSALRKLPNGKVAVKLSAVPELASIGGAVRVGSLNGTPFAVTRTGKNRYSAFSLSCPHAGAIVKRDAEGWLCALHGSKFDANGGLLLGPAITALKNIPTRLQRGLLIIG